jgi:hypothetical protein
MNLFPFAALGLLALLAHRAGPGRRVIVALATLASSVLSWLVIAMGMMAP